MTATLYDEYYYSAYGAAHAPYGRDDPRWMAFFRNIAERIDREIAPRTVLDAGCAKGFLVENLRDRGIEAYGVDISEHAIGEVRDDIRPHCWVGSLTDPLTRHYDLIVSIEVLEHVPVESIDDVVANLCAHTDDIVMSTTPDEYADPTHLNVRPAEYWIELFGHHGFHHDLQYDPSYIAPWALRMRRIRDAAPRIFAGYEREVYRLRAELRERIGMEMQQRNDLAEQAARIQELSGAEQQRLVQQLTADVRRLEEALLASDQRYDELSEMLDRYLAFAGSLAGRSASKLQRTVTAMMPKGTRRGRALRRTTRTVRLLIDQGPKGVREARRQPAVETDPTGYQRWLQLHEPTPDQLTRTRLALMSWQDRPTFSVIMPVYNTDPALLEEAVQSVRDQAYDRWELCIADDASPAPHIRPLLERFATDPRIKVAFREENGGIAAGSNTALGLATGEFVALLDHDDVLRPHALASMAGALREHPDAGFVYSDEDKLRPDGSRAEVAFKPGWSPDLMFSGNYVCHFSVIRRELVERVGGFRPGYDGSQDYDLFLRVIDTGCEVQHVAEVLYSWRQIEGSAALSTTAKPYAYEAALRALRDSFARRNVAGHVEPGASLGWYYAHYDVPKDTDVTIVIPTRDRVDLMRRCLASLANTTAGAPAGILIVDNGSTDAATVDFLNATEHRVLRHPGPFNFSRIVNEAVRATDTTCVLLLNNDIEALEPGWIQAMLEQTMRPEVGAVGARLKFPDGHAQHEGVIVGYRDGAASNVDYGGYMTLGAAIRDVSAVTGACMMFRRSVFDEMEGFDERLRVALNDVDFCLRLRAAGYRVIYTPLATLLHEQSASRGRLHPMDDEKLFREIWERDGALSDPYFSPHIEQLAPLRIRLT